MYLYCMRIGEHGPIKIGYATNVERRLKSIQCGCPEKVSLIGKIECSNADEASKKEGMIHRLLWDYRMSGEWFYPSKRVTETVGKILSGVDFGDLLSWDEALDLSLLETEMGEHVKAIYHMCKEMIDAGMIERVDGVVKLFDRMTIKIHGIMREKNRRLTYFDSKYQEREDL